MALLTDPAIRYEPPPWMPPAVTPNLYSRWVKRMARAVFRRDQQRGGTYAAQEAADAIHDAVMATGGRDPYIGVTLRWDLILRGNNEQHLLKPVVDHRNSRPEADFVICSQFMNAAKGALPEAEMRRQLAEVCGALAA